MISFNYLSFISNKKGRGGGFYERNSFNRNQSDDNNEDNAQRQRNLNNSRGGFYNRRGQLERRENSDFGRRGDRGSQRGGKIN